MRVPKIRPVQVRYLEKSDGTASAISHWPGRDSPGHVPDNSAPTGAVLGHCRQTSRTYWQISSFLSHVCQAQSNRSSRQLSAFSFPKKAVQTDDKGYMKKKSNPTSANSNLVVTTDGLLALAMYCLEAAARTKTECRRKSLCEESVNYLRPILQK